MLSLAWQAYTPYGFVARRTVFRNSSSSIKVRSGSKTARLATAAWYENLKSRTATNCAVLLLECGGRV